MELVGLAASSGRSLFLFGPPGNGKTSIGRKVQAALPGDYWIPHAVSVGNDVIRLFDEQMSSARRDSASSPGRSINDGFESVVPWSWSAAS